MSIILNLTGVGLWAVVVHNKDLVYPSFNRMFGETFVIIYPRPDESELDEDSGTMSHSFELFRTRWKFLSTSKSPCNDNDEEEKTSTQDCVEEYIEREFGCRLPWRKHDANSSTSDDAPICERKPVLRKFTDFMFFGASKMIETTGCLPPCARHEYSIRKINEEGRICSLKAQVLRSFALSTGPF